MSLPKSPFASSTSKPGTGDIVLSLLPPGKQVLTTFTYQYPLKLIAPDPHHAQQLGQESEEEFLEKHVTVVFLLTYGGGLVAGDKIRLKIEAQDLTRLVLVTQGSTKIFKAPPHRSLVSGQILDVKIGVGAGVCYLPDPTQPFAESLYEQKQSFYVDRGGTSSLLMLDWVSEGRRARGESWNLWGWKGRNEIREFDDHHSSSSSCSQSTSVRGRLLLRDAVILTDDIVAGTGLVDKTNDMGIFGTLIVYGPMFARLGQFIMEQFTNQPRIGAQNWSQETKVEDKDPAKEAGLRAELLRRQEKEDELLWTAASVRGFVLVKFGAREIDGARRWLGGLLKREGSVEAQFGHQALICLR